MDINLVQPPHQIIPQTTKTRIIRAPRFVPATHPWTRFRNTAYRFKSAYTAQVAENDFGLVGDGSQTLQTSIKTLPQIKEDLYQALQGINRGIYGVPSAKKSEIEGLVRLLESQNPTPDPTQNLDKVAGWWKLVYSTITILGSRKTKLGLRDFITLGNFYQNIEVDKGKAIDVIKFNVRGLNMLNGQLTIEAFFNIASNSRVDIKFDKSTITPDQLMNLFRRNYDLLLGIFNPEGWLDISYVDDTLKIGRDDKGNIFILERCEEPET